MPKNLCNFFMKITQKMTFKSLENDKLIKKRLILDQKS